MNKRQEELLLEYLSQIPESYRSMFRILAEFAAELGYVPVRCKTKDLTMDFKCSRTKKTIMKMEVKEQAHEGFRCGEREMPGLRLKFFAVEDYSGIYQRGVQHVIEAFDGKYTGCYGCGRCEGKPQGYVFQYPDGREVFRCGSELIPIFNFDEENIAEIQRLLSAQAAYFETERIP